MCFRPVEAALPITCPECGTTNSNGAKKCFKCGADLTTAAASGKASAESAPMAAPAAPPSKKPAATHQPISAASFGDEDGMSQTARTKTDVAGS